MTHESVKYPVENKLTDNTFKELHRTINPDELSKDDLVNLNALLGEASEHLNNATYTTDDEHIVLRIGACVGIASAYLVEAQELILNKIDGTQLINVFKKLTEIIGKLEINELYNRVIDENDDVQYILLGNELGKYGTKIDLLKKTIINLINKHSDNLV
jgi:hypothetical protein